MAELIKGFNVNGEQCKLNYNELANKPFGYDTTIDIIPNISTSTTSGDDPYASSDSIPTNKYFAKGDECIVTFNGVNYELTPSEGSYPFDLYLGESDVDYPHYPIFDNYPFLIYLGEYGYILCTEDSGDYTFSVKKKDKTRLPMEAMPNRIDAGYKLIPVISNSNLGFEQSSNDYVAQISSDSISLNIRAKYKVTIGEISFEVYSIGSELGDNTYTKYPFFVYTYYDTTVRVSEEFYNKYHPTSIIIEEMTPNAIPIAENITVYKTTTGVAPEEISLVDALNLIASWASLDLYFCPNKQAYDDTSN